MSVGPTSGRRRGTLARGKMAHHTYSVKGDPTRVVLTLESSGDLDLLVNRDGSQPYPGKADRVSRTTDGSEEVALEEFGDEIGVGVHANEAGEYELAVELVRREDGNGGRGSEDDERREPNREVPPDDPWPDKPNVLVVDGTADNVLEYRVAVSGELKLIARENEDRSLIDTDPDVDGRTAVGLVSGADHHLYRFSGELVKTEFEGAGRAIHNGEVVYQE